MRNFTIILSLFFCLSAINIIKAANIEYYHLNLKEIVYESEFSKKFTLRDPLAELDIFIFASINFSNIKTICKAKKSENFAWIGLTNGKLLVAAYKYKPKFGKKNGKSFVSTKQAYRCYYEFHSSLAGNPNIFNLSKNYDMKDKKELSSLQEEDAIKVISSHSLLEEICRKTSQKIVRKEVQYSILIVNSITKIQGITNLTYKNNSKIYISENVIDLVREDTEGFYPYLMFNLPGSFNREDYIFRRFPTKMDLKRKPHLNRSYYIVEKKRNHIQIYIRYRPKLLKPEKLFWKK